MASISALGVGSGIDLAGLLDGLMAMERKPLDSLQSKVSSYNSTISALGALSSKLSALRTAAQDLRPSALQTPLEKFATYTGSLGDEKAGTVTVGEGAVAGNYNLEIVSLAKGQKTIASGLNAAGGTLDFSFADSSRDFSVNVAAGATMEDVAKAINAKNGDVSATVVNGNMILSGKEGADSAFTINSGIFSSATNNQLASNAEIRIDGITVTSQSNKISDALTGVTIDLSQTASPGTTTLSITRDSGEKLQSSLEAFVKAFNEAVTSMKTLGSYDKETTLAGPLQGKSILRESESMLSRLVFDTKLSTTDAQGNPVELSLSAIGIAFSKSSDGTLSLDVDKLKAAVAANPEGIAKFAAEIGRTFDESLDKVVGTGGRIDLNKDSITSSIRMLEKQAEAMERRLEMVEARYRTQFSALDTLVARMSSTSNWLAQTLAGLAIDYSGAKK
ncbi:MAG: flagellar filament capping protein FliD [Betaproteobacteria bacterium]|nr:flagellar filament capping protein FliD [Betaproteobacteria bacterium]